jgi:hypothetical protein
MGSVNEKSALLAVEWRTNVDDVIVKGVLTRFRGLADPLGHQKGVMLAGVGDPLRLGSQVLFVNRRTTWSKRREAREVTKSAAAAAAAVAAPVLTRFRGLDNASDGEGTKSQSEDHDGDDDDLPPLEWVPVIPGGMELHIDEKLKSGANRLMELWKGAVQTKDGVPHVERFNCSMGGHLTTTALHPRFEALVHGVDPKAHKPQFCMGLDQGNNPRISLGGKQVSPIQDFKSNLKAIVWMLVYNCAFSWPLAMVDQLQMDMQSDDHPGRGFFTLGEFRDKKHEKSDLHLVMERDENKGKARIWAMLPVEEAEILVEKRKELDQESMPSDSDEDASGAKKAPRKENKAKKKKANGGAPAATAKAAAANMKKKAV